MKIHRPKMIWSTLATVLSCAFLVMATGCHRGTDASANIGKRDLNNKLFRAAVEGNVNLVRALLDAGADVNAREEEGETPLMYASVEGRTEVVLLLISRSADVNAISTNNET